MKKKLVIIIITAFLLVGLFSCTMSIKHRWNYWKQSGLNFMYKIANDRYDTDTPIAKKNYLCLLYDKNSSVILIGIHFPTSAAGTPLGALVGHSDTGTFYFKKSDGTEEAVKINGAWVSTRKGINDEPDEEFYFAADYENNRQLFDLFCENASLEISYGKTTKTFLTDGFEESLEKICKLTRNGVYEIFDAMEQHVAEE